MPLPSGPIPRAHAIFGRPAEIVEQRRALYAVVLDVVAGPAPAVDREVLDNPLVRGHLGDVLAGAPFRPDRLRPLGHLVTDRHTTDVRGHPVRVATSPEGAALQGALDVVVAQLRRNGDRADYRIASGAGGGAELVAAGAELLAAVAPELADDLLPHVAVVGIVAPGIVAGVHGARLGSASAREFPGLVLLPEPASPLEVAEALVHEGAHQKFFDLCVTRSMLAAHAGDAPPLRTSWARPDAPAWPIEQVLAAWHAYCCLESFWSSLDRTQPVHDGSLLRQAGRRRRELEDVLVTCGSFLDVDGHRFLHGIAGRWPVDPPVDATSTGALVGRTDRVVGEAAGRTVVALPGHPVELYWLDAAGR